MLKFPHENSKSKRGHIFVNKYWSITFPTGVGSPFDSEQLRGSRVNSGLFTRQPRKYM